MKINDSVYCKSIGIYSGQLTKRKPYTITETNSQNVRIQNDEGKLKWYSKFYFGLNNEPEIVSIHIDNEILDEESDTVEVTIEFSNHERYWVVFTTTKYLDQVLHEETYFSVFHYIIVKNLNENSIRSAIYKLDEQNELIENCKKY
jgi:hypothetical protein